MPLLFTDEGYFFFFAFFLLFFFAAMVQLLGRSGLPWRSPGGSLGSVPRFRGAAGTRPHQPGAKMIQRNASVVRDARWILTTRVHALVLHNCI